MGAHADISWELFVQFVAEPQVAEDKNALEGWSPVKFRDNRRAKANVEAVSCIVLDDDAGALDLQTWAPFAGVIHTSHSHTPEHPKYRIVLRCSRDMNADEHARVWRHVAAGRGLDEGTKDASRLWYVPAHREGAPYMWCELTGELLDVDVILATTTPQEAPKAVPPAPGRLDGGLGRRRAMAAALGAAWPTKGRHEAQLALAGALRGEGFTEAEAVDFLCDVCRAAGDEDRPKRIATVRHTWSREIITGWTRLKAHVDPGVVDIVRGGLGRDVDLMQRLASLEMTTVTNEGGIVEVDGLRFETGGLDAELPPIPYQVGTFIARGEVVMLVAQGNSLKTWLAFSFAHAVASGRTWLGKFDVTRGRVGILDFESGSYEVKRRLKLLKVSDGDVGDRLLRCSYPSLDLTKAESWATLAKLQLDFLVWDSFAAASRGQDENDARAALMLQYAGGFADATTCTVAVIHHARKGSGGDEREQVRGSTALYAACDRVFSFSEPEKKDGGVVLTTMKSIKDGAGRRPPEVRVELSDQGLRFVDAPIEAEEPAVDTNRALVIETLKKNPRGVAKTDLVNVMKGKRETKFELLSQMVLAGLLVEYKDHAEKKLFVRLNHGVEL